MSESFRRSISRAVSKAMAGFGNVVHLHGFAPPVRGTKELLEVYSDSPWLRGVVSKIGRAVAETDWRLFVEVSGGQQRAVFNSKLNRGNFETRKNILKALVDKNKAKEITDHPLLDLLDYGNEFLNGFSCLQVTQIHIDLVGEAFWLLERNGLGMPISYWPLPPNWIAKFPTKDKPTYLITGMGGGATLEVPVTEVIRFVDPNPAQPYNRGSGIGKSLGDEIEIDEYSAKHLKAFFYNRARPDIIVSGDNISEADAQRLEQQWQNKHGGFWNSFKPLFFSRKIEIKEMTQSMESLQMVGLRKMERDTFVSVYGVPPEKIGIVSDSKRCHDDQTEVLTTEGWLTHDKLTEEHEIATWNQDEDRFEYQCPTAIHRYQYAGKMHHWKNKIVDCMVTPNHRMLVSAPRSKNRWTDWSRAPSEDILNRNSKVRFKATTGGCVLGKADAVLIPFVGIQHPREMSIPPENGEYHVVDSVDMAKFLGYWITEGYMSRTCARVGVSQNKGSLAVDMFDSLKALNLGDVRVNGQTTYTGNVHEHMWLVDRSLKVWLQENVGQLCHEKRLPDCVWSWPEDHKRILFRAMMDGDGHWEENSDRINLICNGSWYSTTSKQLGDDFHRLATELGISAMLRVRKGTKKFNNQEGVYKDQYTIRLAARKHFAIEPDCCTEVDYDGEVWCVSVPNEAFVTRREGSVSVHLNSTIAAADLFWQKDILRPRIETLRRVLQRQLVPMFDERLVLDYTEMVIQDEELDLKTMSEATFAFTINDWRDKAHLPQLQPSDGDVLVVPLNSERVPLGEVDAPRVEEEVTTPDEAAIGDVSMEKITEAVAKNILQKKKVKM